MSEVSTPLALVCQSASWTLEPDQAILREALLPERLKRRLRSTQFADHSTACERLRYAVCDRFALALVSERLLGYAPLHPFRLSLSHTPLGGPKLRWRGAAAVQARARSLQARDTHISFTHDGGTHLTLVASAPGLRGLGVDLVHLPRLRRNGRDTYYLRRFARRFMSDQEYDAFLATSREDDEAALHRRVAAHFSLMEAASKALGTGLRIGGGIGRPGALPCRALGISQTEPRVEFLLEQEAQARCAVLGASRLEGHYGEDGEFLVSAVLLW